MEEELEGGEEEDGRTSSSIPQALDSCSPLGRNEREGGQVLAVYFSQTYPEAVGVANALASREQPKQELESWVGATAAIHRM